MNTFQEGPERTLFPADVQLVAIEAYSQPLPAPWVEKFKAAVTEITGMDPLVQVRPSFDHGYLHLMPVLGAQQYTWTTGAQHASALRKLADELPGYWRASYPEDDRTPFDEGETWPVSRNPQLLRDVADRLEAGQLELSPTDRHLIEWSCGIASGPILDHHEPEHGWFYAHILIADPAIAALARSVHDLDPVANTLDKHEYAINETCVSCGGVGVGGRFLTDDEEHRSFASLCEGCAADVPGMAPLDLDDTPASEATDEALTDA